jgi:putative transposase
VTLPGIGVIPVHDDTRRLRRLLNKGRAKILFATINYRAGRWWVALNVEADDLHPACRHPMRGDGDSEGWIGIDRGLSAFAVAAADDGTEVFRTADSPKALATGFKQQKRLAKSLSRKKKGSANRYATAGRLACHHDHVRTCADIFYTRYRTRWLRPTTGSL